MSPSFPICIVPKALRFLDAFYSFVTEKKVDRVGIAGIESLVCALWLSNAAIDNLGAVSIRPNKQQRTASCPPNCQRSPRGHHGIIFRLSFYGCSVLGFVLDANLYTL